MGSDSIYRIEGNQMKKVQVNEQLITPDDLATISVDWGDLSVITSNIQI